MAGRRGARAGRGWDAIPPRRPRTSDEHPPGDSPGDETERGNVPPRRRRGSPGGTPNPARDGLPWSAADRDGAPSARRDGLPWSAAGRGDALSAADRNGALSAGGRDGALSAGGRGESRRGRSGRAQPEQSEGERAREICLRQLAVRPRTRAELAKVLARKEISDEVIAEVLDRYDEVGIIDDAAFARAWVSSRHHGRGLARRALANELRQRGVDAEVASEALETLDEEDEAATARALVDRKLRTASGSPEAVFRRLVAMLARKGYPAGVAIRAVKDALAARDAEAAEFAEAIDADALADESTDPS
ncbi:hypothetical protein Ade02nite_06100 [Paractinoplanes deccanensis]|uniref:Regulatory protein RecX n=1 Tax=Paractinoplanes deccanensis TaxID=113561 RepID=A0ABQ3XW61_9ACTN|nr:hypothetical protein Ade02nite_06100 [Actinoplanes deccanensis]